MQIGDFKDTNSTTSEERLNIQRKFFPFSSGRAGCLILKLIWKDAKHFDKIAKIVILADSKTQ